MGKWVLAGLALLGVLLIVGAVVAFISASGSGSTAEGAVAGVAGIVMILFYVAGFFAGWLGTTIVCYITLVLLQSLPERDLGDNLVNIGKVALFITLLSLIPFIGWIAGIIVFLKSYNLGFGGCVVYVIVSFVFTLILFGLLFAAIAALGMTFGAMDLETAALVIRNVSSGSLVA